MSSASLAFPAIRIKTRPFLGHQLTSEPKCSISACLERLIEALDDIAELPKDRHLQESSGSGQKGQEKMRIPSKSFEFMKKVSKTRTRSRTTGTERFREKPRVARFATSSPATKKKAKLLKLN